MDFYATFGGVWYIDKAKVLMYDMQCCGNNSAKSMLTVLFLSGAVMVSTGIMKLVKLSAG